MKPLTLLAMAAAMGAGTAAAQPITPIVNGGQFPGRQITPIANGGHFQGGGAGFTRHRDGGHRGGKRRFHGFGGFGGFGGVWVVEREVPVIIEREVVREVAAPEPPPPTPRKPYKIGASYDSLPGGCFKLIEGGASYYHCSGEWYREVGSGSAVRYQAVARQRL